MKPVTHWLVGLLLCGLAMVALAGPVSFADLARHPRYTMVKISPDGTHIAASAVLANGQTVLSLVDLATRKGVNITPREGDDVEDFWWVSPKYVVYDESEHLGGWDAPLATGELYSVEADGGSPTMIYGYRMNSTEAGTRIQHAEPEAGSAAFLARIDGDPYHILVTVTPWSATGSLGTLTFVYRMDVRDGVKTRVASAPIREASFLADHHGHVRFAFGNDIDGHARIYMRGTDGGDWQLLGQASQDRDWPIAFSADDRTVWVACPGKPSGFGVCRLDPATRQLTHVWHNRAVESTTLAQGLAEDSVIGVRFTDGRPAISVFDNQAPGVKALIGLMQQYPGEDVHFVSGTADGSKAIALVQADVDPGTFFLYDRAANKFSPLLQRAAWIDPDQLGRAVPYTFKTRDGLTEQGYVTYPPGKQGARDLPLVVFVHGGPYGIRDWWRYDPYVQALATRGYAVLQVNYRGSGGYGYAFEQAGWHQWGAKMQDDVTDATRWAIAQGIADKNRICIYGGSYGGYAALEGAVDAPDLYKCTIGYVGVYNLPAMLDRRDAAETLYATDFWKRTMGTDQTVLEQHSPIYQLNNLKAKVMLIVGGRDTIVPPSQGEDLRMALLQRGIKPVWLYKAGEWHGFYDPANIAELFAKVDAFVAANIGPGVAAAPAKQ
ncbi:MAG: S9 family peptidase [Rhodanobacteraceae bacterium]|nr:MAG: S9 family peptidase [Rhodanobacteraceae bacterium]